MISARAILVLGSSLASGCGSGALPGESKSTDADTIGETGDPPEQVLVLEPAGPPECGLTPYGIHGKSTASSLVFGDFRGEGVVELVERTYAAVPTDDGVQHMRLLAPVAGPPRGYSLVHEWSYTRPYSDISVFDHNGDGLGDLLHSSADLVWAELGLPGGAFAPPLLFPGVGDSTQVVDTYEINTRDANGDLRADLTLAWGRYEDATVALFLALPEGGYAAPIHAPVERCFMTASEWADLDNDGDAELALVDGCSGNGPTNLQIFELDGDALVEHSSIPIGDRFNPWFLRRGDFNGDAYVDLVLTLPQLGPDPDNHNRFGLFWGSADGLVPVLDERVTVDWPSAGHVLAAGDGPSNLAFEHNPASADESGDRVSLLFNDGTGEFTICTLSGEWGLYAAADVDGDGFGDVVTQRTTVVEGSAEHHYALWVSGG